MTHQQRLLQNSEKGLVRFIAFALNLISGATLLAMMLITCIDVIGRYFLNKPLFGSTEISEVLLGVMIFTALPVISWRNEQVVVDILDSFVSPRLNFIRGVIFNVLSAIALYFLGQRIIALGARALKSGETTEYLHIPVGTVLNSFGILCWVTAVALLTLGIYRLWVEYQMAQAPIDREART